MEKKCPYCNQSVDSNAVKCPRCGGFIGSGNPAEQRNTNQNTLKQMCRALVNNHPQLAAACGTLAIVSIVNIVLYVYWVFLTDFSFEGLMYLMIADRSVVWTSALLVLIQGLATVVLYMGLSRFCHERGISGGAVKSLPWVAAVYAVLAPFSTLIPQNTQAGLIFSGIFGVLSFIISIVNIVVVIIVGLKLLKNSATKLLGIALLLRFAIFIVAPFATSLALMGVDVAAIIAIIALIQYVWNLWFVYIFGCELTRCDGAK